MRTLAVIAAVGFVAITLFQAALAFGAPMGRAAWGGARAHLPPGLRVASGIAAVFWSLAAAVVLARAGVGPTSLPDVVARWGTWILVVVLGLGTLMNAASSSPWSDTSGHRSPLGSRWCASSSPAARETRRVARGRAGASIRSRPRCERSPTAPRRRGGRPEPSRRCSGSRRSRRYASRPGPSDDRSRPGAIPSPMRIPGVRRPPAARARWLERIADASSSGTSGSVPICARMNVTRSAGVDRRAPAPVRPGMAQRPTGPPHPFVPAARRLRWSSLRVITVSRRPRGR
jgi:hypothetical protein